MKFDKNYFRYLVYTQHRGVSQAFVDRYLERFFMDWEDLSIKHLNRFINQLNSYTAVNMIYRDQEPLIDLLLINKTYEELGLN